MARFVARSRTLGFDFGRIETEGGELAEVAAGSSSPTHNNKHDAKNGTADDQRAGTKVSTSQGGLPAAAA